MAKYERQFQGNFDVVLGKLFDHILSGSASASYEDGSDYSIGETRCAVRVFERYSITGGNRLSLTLTLVGNGSDLFLSAITAGGSQGIFLKINTWGEQSFLNEIQNFAEKL